jgi:hypothetical protein
VKPSSISLKGGSKPVGDKDAIAENMKTRKEAGMLRPRRGRAARSGYFGDGMASVFARRTRH